MPRQNRVTPFSTIEAVPSHGTLMGNRGILHDDRGRLGIARWRHPHWVTCVLEFKGRWRPVMQPHAYTELFFLDEVTAFAAGHRPCGECRRPDYKRFLDAWAKATGADRRKLRAVAIDEIMQESRHKAGSREQRTWRTDLAGLPDGTFVKLPGGDHAWVVTGSRLLRWSHDGYDAQKKRFAGEVEVLTPKVTVAAFTAGYRPTLHSSARRLLAH